MASDDLHRPGRSIGGRRGTFGTGATGSLGAPFLFRAVIPFALTVLYGGCDGRTVPPDATPAVRAAVEACGGEGREEKQTCYEERLLEELARSGVGPALEMLEAVGTADVDVAREGHVYTHAIGIAAYSADASVTEVFRECTVLYQSGCYHGVIQAHFIAEGSADEATVRDLCQPYDGDPADRWLFFQCLHGLGHGLTMFYGHHLPTALGRCDFLTNDWNRESCYGGAFMENVVNATSPHHPASELVQGEASPDAASGDGHDAHAHKATSAFGAPEGTGPFEALRPDDPHYPCSILDDRYLTACYMMQTSAMLWHNSGDVGDAAESCGEAPEPWRRTCFQSLGRDVSARTLQDPDRSLSECGQAPEAYREWCYVGLVKNFVDLTAATDAGFAFCTRVEDWAKPRCHEAMGEEINVLHPTASARREACAASETAELERDCLRGARVRVD